HEAVDVGPGALVFELDGLAVPVQLQLYGARMQLVAGPDHIDGVLAGVVPSATVREQLIPAWKITIDAIIARDCVDPTLPVCGCLVDWPGRELMQYLDWSPQDCMLTVDELVNSSWVMGLTESDVTVDGQPGLSFGVGISGDGPST